MASVSFSFTCCEKQSKVDATIFEGLQIFVNAFQKLTARLNMVRHIAIAARTHLYVPPTHVGKDRVALVNLSVNEPIRSPGLLRGYR